MYVTTAEHQIPSDRDTCVFLQTFIYVLVCNMRGSLKYGALGRQPARLGLGEVLMKEVYEFRSHWIFFRSSWETQPGCIKEFDRRTVEAGTNVTPGHPGRKLQVGLLPDRLGEGRSRGCRHGRVQGWAKLFESTTVSWEGFHKNKLWTRTVIVHMDIFRLKAYDMFHGLFFLQYLSRILQITWLLS